MKTQRYGKIVLLILLAVQISFAGLYSVAKDGVYKTVQSAIDAAGPGDVVQIEDLGVYEEQVTIDSTKNGLVLKSLNPAASKKPVIRFQDTKNVLPKTGNQAKHQDSINFDQNGALRVMRARNVTIEGIRVEGGGAKPFAYEGIWNDKDPLFHGNAAICLWIAGNVVIRNCDLTDAYFGINIKDRNEGGIFANANPADIDTWNIVPLSGFGLTGNHIIEDNRIHHNSWGIFFESVWDQGSIIRYNLFYENHHNSKLKGSVTNMPDGNNQAGGALFFKDHLLSPLAIHNNTFWHNHTSLAGHWRAGAQHLVFNNIVAQPDILADEYVSIDAQFINRMHHCLYAVQSQAVQQRSQEYQTGRSDPETNEYVEARVTVKGAGNVRIMEGMTKIETEGQNVILTLPLSTEDVEVTQFADWVIQPGARVMEFGNNNVRWFEMKFLSTDTASPDFLVPDWNNPDVEKLVLDQGWPDAGILDADGSIADLGAIPKGGRVVNNVVVRANMPVLISGTEAEVSFDVLGLHKERLSNLKVKYIKWIKNVVFQGSAFGRDCDSTIIPSSAIISVTVPNTPITMDGSNNFAIQIPARGAREYYAFFELILEGENSNGEKEVSSVGFLPFRAVDYKFDVKILDTDGKTELTEVKVGQMVKISVTPVRLDGKPFDVTVSNCEMKLGSGYNMYNEKDEILKITEVQGTVIKDGYFTKIPLSGTDNVAVSGAYGKQIFFGSSQKVRILPGDPEKVTFQTPPSKGYAEIPGFLDNGSVRVEDKFGNAVGKGIQVKIKSTTPDIGDILKSDETPAGGEDVVCVTDSTGIASFKATVTEGDKGDTIPLIATLVENNATDSAKLIVGNKKPKFFILYSDTAKFDISKELRGCAGVRVPVTIIASSAQMGDTIIDTLNRVFNIDLPHGIAAYKTESLDDTVRINSDSLIKGKAKIWIKSTTGPQSNKEITITGKNDNLIIPNSRKGIYFDPCGPIIERAAYFANNGYGQVDRLEIWYKEELESSEIPDSLKLYWPDEQPGFLRMVKKSDISLDDKDAKHVIVKINPAFDKQITFTNKSRLGTSYWNDPNLDKTAPTDIKNFSIADSVGPVLTYAKVIEKLNGGNDTMFIRFSENVNTDLIKGTTLTLVKKDGKKFNLNVLDAYRLSDTIRIVVEDLKENSPAVGDSLQILNTGTIADQYKNKARPDNQPVPLKLKLVPPNVKNAYYIDSDGDGFVDSVCVKLDKYVSKEIITATCVWSEGNNSTDTLRANNMSHSSKDSNVICIYVKGRFSKNEVRTHGTMSLNLSFAELGSIQPAPVADSAAPVIVKAEYFPGSFVNGNFAPDTLKVTFSEETKYEVPVANPFNMYQKGTKYTIDLQKTPKAFGNGYQFVLENNESIKGGVRYPENGDSIHINVENPPFSDGKKYQEKPTNRKVALEVKGVPTDVVVKVGPNPFIIDMQEMTVRIEPLAKMVENVEAKSTIIIYDQMGNKLWSDIGYAKDYPDRKIKFKWKGQNLKNRKVGKGTYLAIVRTEYGDINDTNKKVNIANIPIGVKENK